jgi:hypothetical protein
MKKIKAKVNYMLNERDYYKIKDLTMGGFCGCCGAWIANEIVPKNDDVIICKKCLNIE